MFLYRSYYLISKQLKYFPSLLVFTKCPKLFARTVPALLALTNSKAYKAY